MICHYPSAAKSSLKQIEHLAALSVLTDMKLRHELNSQSRSRIALDSYMETTFSVDEAG
jgi:hypothetical protein